MDWIKKRYKTILLTLSLIGLTALLLSIGGRLQNRYLAHEQKQYAEKNWGQAGRVVFEAFETMGFVGLYHYSRGLSTVHTSTSRLELLDRALQGQSQYMEVLRLQLAMQNLRGDFLEKDLAVAEEKMAKFNNNDHNSRTPAAESP